MLVPVMGSNSDNTSGSHHLTVTLPETKTLSWDIYTHPAQCWAQSKPLVVLAIILSFFSSFNFYFMFF